MALSFLLTPDGDVLQAAKINEGAVELASCGGVFTSPATLVPLFRAYNQTTQKHFYTILIDEYDDAINDHSHDGEEIACYCFSQ
jgi:hypothetical protein